MPLINKPIQQYTFEELKILTGDELRTLLGIAKDKKDLLVLGQVMKNSIKLPESEMCKLPESGDNQLQEIEFETGELVFPFEKTSLAPFSTTVKSMVTKLQKEWPNLSDEKKQERTHSIMMKMEKEAK